MKIENWERIDHSQDKVEWKHDSGVRVFLTKHINIYRLTLFDASGVEHYYEESPNRSRLEHTAADWQRQYNRELRRSQ